MGMIGSVAKHALNFAGINLLGRDFLAEKRRADEQAIRRAQLMQLFGDRAPAPVMNQAGEDISAGFGPMGGGPRVPSVGEAAPTLAAMLLRGDRGATDILGMIKDAQPKPLTPLNTTRGPREYDPNTGAYRVLERFDPEPPKPEPVTTDRVIGGIMAKMASGEKLSPPEQAIYNRWFSGTPPKPSRSGGGAGLPPPPTGWRPASQ